MKTVSHKRKAKRLTVWQALNEPVVEVSEGFAKLVFGLTALILFVAWIGPHWGTAQAATYGQGLNMAASERSAIVSASPIVAGAQVSEAPQWYQVMQYAPGEVAGAFTQASYEVLDVSGPVAQVWEFYKPGFEAVRDAWLELMADPV